MIFVEVKTRQGIVQKTFVGEAESSNAVEHLKKKIREAQGIPYEEQVLRFGGHQLKEDTTLGYYGVWKVSSSCPMMTLYKYTDIWCMWPTEPSH